MITLNTLESEQSQNNHYLLEFRRAMPSLLINAIACIFEEVAATVRVFGVTRKTKVPYVSYLTHDGKSVSGFIKREILSKFQGTHVGYKDGTLTVTDLATGSQQVAKLEYGDRIRVLVDRYQNGSAGELGQVVNVLPNDWVRVKVGTMLLWFPESELELIGKSKAWQPAPSALTYAFSGRRDWSKEPDDVVFAAAEEAKRDLGF